MCPHRTSNPAVLNLTKGCIYGPRHIEKEAFSTNLYEKPLVLHLYIPPHSCHPPIWFDGLIRVIVLRICRLCSKRTDRTFWLEEFYGHLLNRGYPNSFVLPAFKSAVKNAISYISTGDKYRLQQKAMSTSAKNTLHFHLKYNPIDPSSKQIQKKLERSGSFPRQQTSPLSFEKLPKKKRKESQGWSLTTADISILATYFPKYRKFCNRPGLKVSSFMN